MLSDIYGFFIETLSYKAMEAIKIDSSRIKLTIY